MAHVHRQSTRRQVPCVIIIKSLVPETANITAPLFLLCFTVYNALVK